VLNVRGDQPEFADTHLAFGAAALGRTLR